MAQRPTVGLHPAPRPGGVPARAATVLVRPELVPPPQRSEADVAFVRTDAARRLDGQPERLQDQVVDESVQPHCSYTMKVPINKSIAPGATHVRRNPTGENQSSDGARRCRKSMRGRVRLGVRGESRRHGGRTLPHRGKASSLPRRGCVGLPRVATVFAGLLCGASVALPVPFDVRGPIASFVPLIFDGDGSPALRAVAAHNNASVQGF